MAQFETEIFVVFLAQLGISSLHSCLAVFTVVICLPELHFLFNSINQLANECVFPRFGGSQSLMLRDN